MSYRPRYILYFYYLLSTALTTGLANALNNLLQNVTTNQISKANNPAQADINEKHTTMSFSNKLPYQFNLKLKLFMGSENTLLF